MTDYRDLDEDEQDNILAALQDEAVDSQTFIDVMKGYKCAVCWMNYYNCLCSHEE